jgi:hypothetical protein
VKPGITTGLFPASFSESFRDRSDDLSDSTGTWLYSKLIKIRKDYLVLHDNYLMAWINIRK